MLDIKCIDRLIGIHTTLLYCTFMNEKCDTRYQRKLFEMVEKLDHFSVLHSVENWASLALALVPSPVAAARPAGQDWVNNRRSSTTEKQKMRKNCCQARPAHLHTEHGGNRGPPLRKGAIFLRMPQGISLAII